jgi:hypothetical protein
VTVPLITDDDRSGWQRRAARELVRVLDAHPDLPTIAWTVGPAGSVLVGHVDGLAPYARALSCFYSWRLALGLRELAPGASDGSVTYLSASGTRNRVKVQLVATVLDDEDPR